MKLSEYKDEEALDLLADLFEPVAFILADPELRKGVEDNVTKIQLIRIAIKNHKKEVMEVLAILDGVPVEEYHCNIITLPIKLLEIVNDKELLDFFSSQGKEMIQQESSGSVTEITQAKRK